MITLKTLLHTRWIAPLLLAAIAYGSQSVTITLHDGSQIKGSFASGGADEIQVLVAGQPLTLQTASIDAVQFESGQVAPGAPGFTPTSPQSAAIAPEQAGITIPANTAVVVRLIDSADSVHDAVGKEYRASLDEPIVSPAG